ncbi:hypothetical protein F0562_030817 [Nyssa sinensis]|uniref:FLZ-type domain-containing protein n=1 Tax=Nyssa sinensis TaxID=561372 RepID=A0A5J5AY00_9ASTE|nr:hypothetical protein F0562_030817 [Nyssa sinensis]
MADSKGNNKRLTINLSLFALYDPNNNSSTKSTTKSPKNFEPNGVVGLGIVAAMNELDNAHDPFFSAKSSRAAILAVSPRSTPIPIVNINNSSASAKVSGAAKFSGGDGGERPNLEEEEDMELSEGYTCVISHVGNNLIKKREYFDGNLANGAESTTSYWVSSAYASPPPRPQSRGGDATARATAFQTADFLNSCYLCKKKLHGLDIFMYRGEKAFCSAECRYKQISTDEHKEKCGSGAMKQLDYSISPCSSPMQFFAGVAAA